MKISLKSLQYIQVYSTVNIVRSVLSGEVLPGFRKFLVYAKEQNQIKMRADYIPHSGESLGSELSSC